MSSELFEGRYLFHLHTERTDGRLSVQDYVAFAREAAVTRLIFLEHVRSVPTYDIAAFAEDVRSCAVPECRTFVGFEAKILPDGTLDLPAPAWDLADVVGIAEHGFPEDEDLLVSSFLDVVRATSMRPNDVVWVHPGLWWKRRRRDPAGATGYQEMVAAAREGGVLFERNLRYDLVADPTPFAPSELVLGADAHQPRDLERWRTAAT